MTGSIRARWSGVGIAAAALAVSLAGPVWPRQSSAPTMERAADPVIAGFSRSTVASVSDAVDQVVGRRGYLAHDLRPYVAGSFVGRARTAVVRAAPPDKATPALAVKHSVEMIDEAEPGDVGVIVMEGSLDVAAIGGLIVLECKLSGLGGIVVWGVHRDSADVDEIRLPVFSYGTCGAGPRRLDRRHPDATRSAAIGLTSPTTSPDGSGSCASTMKRVPPHVITCRMPSCGMSQRVMRASVPTFAKRGGSPPGRATSSPCVIRQTPNGASCARQRFAMST